MNIRVRLTLMNFLEFFVWGCWLISLGGYMIVTLKFNGQEVGSVYATMGIASMLTPALFGIIADRWVNAERLFGFCHVIGALLLLYASTVSHFKMFYFIMLLNSLIFMPTIALNNTVSYILLGKKGLDIVKDFPPIRVWGTLGFICAMWTVDLLGWTKSPYQLYVSACAGLLLGIYAFTLPGCPPAKAAKSKSLVSSLGLDAFVLFRNKTMLIFFLFAMLLGAALQITNAFGVPFLDDFKTRYADSFAVKHPNILISISQISETLFILTIPFFLKNFGIKRVMLISMVAWVFRFGLFAVGNPGGGLPLLILSMIIYGMAFDFFNISGSLFVEKETDSTIRASAQGLFMFMTNGIGAFVGGVLSGWVVDHFTINGMKQWQSIWLTFSAYALVLAILFPFMFSYKHRKDQMSGVGH
jgi:MFS transporter, NHS family, xanthosine permease